MSRKHKQTSDKSSEPPKKKAPSSNAGALGSDGNDSVVITGTGQIQYKYNPGDEQWQRNACSTLGLVYMGTPGGPDVDLKRPDRLKSIEGDGNCLFRTFSFILTGSENQRMTVRHAILDQALTVMTVSLSLVLDRSSTSTILETSSGSEMPAPLWGWCTWVLQVAQMLI